jgi:hypothetical protein
VEHIKYKIEGADRIAEGAVIDCREVSSNQEVRHRFEVKQVVPNKLIHYVSYGSQAMVKVMGMPLKGKADTYCYFYFVDCVP